MIAETSNKNTACRVMWFSGDIGTLTTMRNGGEEFNRISTGKAAAGSLFCRQRRAIFLLTLAKFRAD